MRRRWKQLVDNLKFAGILAVYLLATVLLIWALGQGGPANAEIGLVIIAFLTLLIALGGWAILTRSPERRRLGPGAKGVMAGGMTLGALLAIAPPIYLPIATAASHGHSGVQQILVILTFAGLLVAILALFALLFKPTNEIATRYHATYAQRHPQPPRALSVDDSATPGSTALRRPLWERVANGYAAIYITSLFLLLLGVMLHIHPPASVITAILYALAIATPPAALAGLLRLYADIRKEPSWLGRSWGSWSLLAGSACFMVYITYEFETLLLPSRFPSPPPWIDFIGKLGAGLIVLSIPIWLVDGIRVAVTRYRAARRHS